MPHTAVPAAELAARLENLRRAMSAAHPDWGMILLDSKIDLYYFTGTMQEGALVITPDEAALFVRHSYECAVRDSSFADIRPLGSFRGIASAFPHIPETVYVATRTMTLQKLAMLQKYLPFAPASIDSILGGLRTVKSAYELECMRHAGKIHAKVDLVGTETAEGAMDLAITVGWYTDYPEDLEATTPINVTFKGQKYDSVVTEYPGKLDVEMLSEMIVSGQDAKVYLQTIDEGVYMFKLPDFRITINETELPCGDIVVEGVTRKDGKLSGSVNDLSLAGGKIHAKVDLAGTETAEGAMDLTITVGWYTDYPDDLSATTPINVTFKGQRDAGVNVVEASGAVVRGAEGAIAVEGFAGRVNVYTVDGRLAASAQVDGEATLTVAAGLYVVRAGEKAVKVVVK